MAITRKVTVFFILLTVPAALAEAQERSIKRSELPPAVYKTVAAESKNASVRGFSQEEENGQVYYEAELVMAGHHKDVLMDSNGHVVEVEEQVAIDSLPVAVRGSLLRKAGKRQLRNVESLTKNGKLVAYEAHLRYDGKRSEIQVGPAGETLQHEE